MILTIMILLAIAMIVAKYYKVKFMQKLSWTAVLLISVALVALGLLIPSFSTGFGSSGEPKDGCGCGPGQLVKFENRGFLGGWSDGGLISCSEFLNLPRSRTRQTACV